MKASPNDSYKFTQKNFPPTIYYKLCFWNCEPVTTNHLATETVILRPIITQLYPCRKGVLITKYSSRTKTVRTKIFRRKRENITKN